MQSRHSANTILSRKPISARKAQQADALPAGTLTFLMTDIEGSTRAWDASPKQAQLAMHRHDGIVTELVESSRGHVVEAGREGDSILAVFRQATDAILCALRLQQAIGNEPWPAGAEMAVRIAVHTGEAELTAGHYVGASLYRCARLMATAHGGQVLISGATEEVMAGGLPEGAQLRDLGRHRLRDFTRPMQVYQLIHADLQSEFPPLNSLELERTNLPEQLTSFVGRQSDLTGIQKALKQSRLV